MYGALLVRRPQLPEIGEQFTCLGRGRVDGVTFQIYKAPCNGRQLFVDFVCLDAAVTCIDYTLDPGETLEHAIELMTIAIKQSVAHMHTEDLVRCKLGGLRVN